MGYGYERSGQESEQVQETPSAQQGPGAGAELNQGNAAALQDAGLDAQPEGPAGQERLEEVEPGFLARYDNALAQHQASVDDCLQGLGAVPAYEAQVWAAIGEADDAEALLVQAVDTVVQAPWDAEVGVDPALAEALLARMVAYEEAADRCAIWAEILEVVAGLRDLQQLQAVLATLAASGLENLQLEIDAENARAKAAEAAIREGIQELGEEAAKELLTMLVEKAMSAFAATCGLPPPLTKVAGWAAAQAADAGFDALFNADKPETTLSRLEDLTGDLKSNAELAGFFLKEGTRIASQFSALEETFNAANGSISLLRQATEVAQLVASYRSVTTSVAANIQRCVALKSSVIAQVQPLLERLGGVAQLGATQLQGLLAQLGGAER
jgi:hypothetical protein